MDKDKLDLGALPWFEMDHVLDWIVTALIEHQEAAVGKYQTHDFGRQGFQRKSAVFNVSPMTRSFLKVKFCFFLPLLLQIKVFECAKYDKTFRNDQVLST